MVIQTSKETVFIVNSSAGHGKCGKRWEKLYASFKHLYPHDVIMTKERGEAESEARKAVERGVEQLFIVGGDGTINEVINGIKDANIALGVIPFGTGNDLAKTLGISTKPRVLENMMMNPETMLIRETNMASINERHFIIACGIGFDGLVAKRANESRIIKKLGALGYLVSALMTLRTFSPLEIDIRIDGQTHKIKNGWLLAVGNAPYYGGGMKICPSAMIDDDLLDLCMVSNLTKPKLLRFMPKVYSGKHAALKQYVTFFRGKRISIYCHGHAVAHADGELIDSSQLDIKLCDYRVKWLTMS
jgi:diacylglycerol kinase (ATP)